MNLIKNEHLACRINLTEIFLIFSAVQMKKVGIPYEDTLEHLQQELGASDLAREELLSSNLCQDIASFLKVLYQGYDPNISNKENTQIKQYIQRIS